MNLYRYVFILSAISLLLIILLGSLNFFSMNKDFYYNAYAKNDVYAKISDNQTYAKEYVKDITDNIFNYLKGKEELKHFTYNEQSHMQDVKIVLNTLKTAYYVSIILFIALFVFMYIKTKNDSMTFIKYLSQTTYWGGLISGASLVIVFLLSVFYFDAVFTIMHLIFFPQGNWTFPMDSLLITLFPQQFFFDISLRIFIFAFVQSIVFFFIGYSLRKQLKIRKEFMRHRL